MNKRLLLSVRNLKTQFSLNRGVVKAVDDIGFDLIEGETLCIVGESGSGKSVAARSILQILDRAGQIVGGEILLHRYTGGESTPSEVIDIVKLGRSSRAMQAVRRQDISMIFQEPMSSLSLAHTCGNQIVEAIHLRHPHIKKRAAWDRAIELLAQMQLPDPALTASQYPFQLSGGMRQRVMIAMALASEPRILIADEPTTALDVTTQAEILALLDRMRRTLGLGVIFITHDLGVVANVADRVAVMQLGKVVEVGDVRSILDRPHHPYTRMLLASAQRLERPAPLRATPTVQASTTPRQPILSVRDLGKTFVLRSGPFSRHRDLHAVDGVSFDVMPGENVGIVGESGSGKSTMARCVVGLHAATGGSMLYRRADDTLVELAGRVRKGADPLLREVRMIFQDPFAALNPRMTIGQIVAEPIRLARMMHGAALKERVGELLSLVGLEPRVMERYPHAFSGGQRQRIVIARAIATNPRLIIADEATSALDVSLRAQMLDLMLELQQRLDLSYVFITHDISNIRYFCDRVVVMYRGKVVESGTVTKVLDSPSDPYTKRLIAAVPRLDPSLPPQQ
jgi:peptide/nickel transport system ATP-binding protein